MACRRHACVRACAPPAPRHLACRPDPQTPAAPSLPATRPPAVNSLARKTKALKEGDANLAGEYIREGLGAVVSVKVRCAALR